MTRGFVFLSVTRNIYFLYVIVVPAGAMSLIQTGGFREEEDVSTRTFPFAATWQFNEVAAFHLQSRGRR